MTITINNQGAKDSQSCNYHKKRPPPLRARVQRIYKVAITIREDHHHYKLMSKGFTKL